MSVASTGSYRQEISFEEGHCSAYIPTALLKIPKPLQAEALTEEQHKRFRKLQKAPVENILCDLTCPPSPSLFSALEDDIKDHLERRIQLAFYQFLFANEFGRTFKIHKTQLQIGSGKNTNDNNQEATSVYAAAHDATLPSLKYLSRKTPTEKAFNKESALVRTWNATILLPSQVNQVDSSIDGTNNGKKLRSDTIKILNAVSSSSLDPENGLICFVDKLLKRIKLAKRKNLDCNIDRQLKDHWKADRRKKVTKKDFDSWSSSKKGKRCRQAMKTANTLQKKVIQWYEDVAMVYQSKLIVGGDFFKKMCFGVNTQNYEHAASKHLWKMRCVNSHGVSLEPATVLETSRPSSRSAPPQVEEGELKKLSKRIQDYKERCIEAENIQVLVDKCFAAKKSRNSITQLKKGIDGFLKEELQVACRKVDLIAEHLIYDREQSLKPLHPPTSCLKPTAKKHKKKCTQATGDQRKKITHLVEKCLQGTRREQARLKLNSKALKVMGLKRKPKQFSDILEHVIYELRP